MGLFYNNKKNEEEDIAPVKDRRFFDRSAAYDDDSKNGLEKLWTTLFASSKDAETNTLAGILGGGEKALDFFATLGTLMAQGQYYQNGGGYNIAADQAFEQAHAFNKAGVEEFVKQDLYDEHEIAKQIVTARTPIAWFNEEVMNEENSVLGERLDSTAYAGGELISKLILSNGLGIPHQAATSAFAFGGSMESALNDGANFEQAALVSLIGSAVEVATGELFAGSGLGEKGLINLKPITNFIANNTARSLAAYGVNMASEGFEEVLSEIVQNITKKIYKDEGWKELLFSQEAWDGYFESLVSGGLLSGVANVGKVGSSIKKGTDYNYELTADERKVADKVVNDIVEKMKKDGSKVTAVEKNKIFEKVLEEMESGDIDIADIEDALGEEVFKDYADTIKYEEDILKQYEELGKKKNYTLAEASLFNELDSKKKDIEQNSPREELKKQMSEKVFERVKGTKLMNSYVDAARRGESFQADVNEYDEAERATIQSAIDAGFLNNTNKTRRFVNWVAKIAAKTGIKVDFTTIEKLKESGFAVDGKFVNGYKTKDGIGINMQSKKILETVVGHEITHVFEGTELYAEMQKAVYAYAEAKGELNSRREDISKLYNGVTKDIDSELTAELVSEYLFTDQEFINRLANDNRNIFQKMWDEVKYMWKQAHPSSPEAQKLEKLKRAFEEAYKASGEVKNTSGGTRFSLSEKKVPSWEEITKKEPMTVVDLTTPQTRGTFAERRKAILDASDDVIANPYLNKDTNTLIFLTKKSYTHAFNNLGVVQLNAVEHLPELIENAILTHVEPADHGDTHVAGVYTFFAASRYGEQIRPVKLKVKEYSYSGQELPKNIKNYFENSPQGFASTYDTVVLEVEEIAESPFGSVEDVIQKEPFLDPKELSTISVADLLALVKGDAEKYLPKSQKNDISVLDGTQLSLSTDTESRKQEQFTIIQETNPAPNSYNTWIRSVNDIKTLAETLQDSDYDGYDEFNPDLTRADIEKAIESGTITVYSSYPIKNGAFVTPSKMEAQSYSGNGKVYQKTVNIDDVAWIDPTQGQYAEVKGTQFSLSEDTEATPRDVYFSRIDEVYDKLKGKSAGKSHMVDGYNFFLQRNEFDESAYISITTPEGKKLRQIVDGGNLWKNARLWREAAKMVANNDYPNVATATTQEEAGEYSEIEGKGEEVEKTFKDKVIEGVSDTKNLGKKAVGYLVDKYQPIENLALKTGNRELDAKANTMRTSERAAQHFIGNGADGVRAINDLRQEVEASGLEKEFEEYMYDLLTTDRMSLEDRAKPVIKKLGDKFKKLRVDQIKAIANKQITDNTTDATAQTIRDAKEYLRAISTRNKPVRGDFYTADIAIAHATELEQKYPQFKQWAEDVYANTNFMLDKLVADGELSQEAADRFRELYPHYVPIRRVNKEGKAVDVPLYSNRTGIDAPIKGATGGDGTIGYLFKTLAMRAEQTFLAGAKNRFGIELKNTLKAKTTDSDVDVEDIFDEVDTHEDRLQAGEDGKAPTFTVFENGKRVTFEIPEDIYEALKPTPEALKGTIPVLSAITKFQRGVLTEYNPFFMARNAVKDFQDVLINSQHAKETYKNFPEAMRQLYAYERGGEDAQYAKEYFENGAEELTYFDGKEKLFNSKDTENPWAKEKDSEAKRVLGFIPSKISQASSFVERVPRLAEYIASRKAGASIDVAMLDAARVTTNFAAGGDVTKWANRNFATFLNASVQGAAQAVRNVREAKAQGLQGMLKLGAKVAIAGIPYLILNALLWGDDDEYEELSDYVKENYYIVAKYGDGQFVRIPKGRMAAVIQSAFDQMSNLVTGDDEVDFKRFGELLVENIAPNNPLENNVFAPIKNVIENKTWYGDDLVPQRLQDLPASEQSDETTDAISKWLGETFNVSPYKLNYLLDQYSGVFGDMFLPTITPQAEGGNSSILGGAIAPLADQFTTDSTMKNQNVSDFYDTLDDLTASAKSKYATDEDVLRYRYMNTINSEMSNLYKQKREIQNSDLPNRTKYEAVREVQRQIDELAKEALASYNDMYIGRNSATVGGITYKKNSKGEWQKVSESSSKSYKLWSDETLNKFIQEYKLPKLNWD